MRAALVLALTWVGALLVLAFVFASVWSFWAKDRVASFEWSLGPYPIFTWVYESSPAGGKVISTFGLGYILIVLLLGVAIFAWALLKPRRQLTSPLG